MTEHIKSQTEISADLDGSRFDQALAKLYPAFSRSRLQQWIKNGAALLDGERVKPRQAVRAGQAVSIDAEIESQISFAAQDIPLDIVFEDEHLLVINKPAGLVVHPGAGNPDHTLLNALLHHEPKLALVPRAGIIHRLDKDTTGLMVVAKTIVAHTSLVAMMQAREIRRHYQCLVHGDVISGGTVDAPIGRHPSQRTKMAVIVSGKPAVTHYRVLSKYPDLTHLDVQLETGRTHQIRVHMALMKYPIVGDPVYGGRARAPAALTPEQQTAVKRFSRQALHAYQLALTHPVTGEEMVWQAPLPEDMQALLALLGE